MENLKSVVIGADIVPNICPVVKSHGKKRKKIYSNVDEKKRLCHEYSGSPMSAAGYDIVVSKYSSPEKSKCSGFSMALSQGTLQLSQTHDSMAEHQLNNSTRIESDLLKAVVFKNTFKGLPYIDTSVIENTHTTVRDTRKKYKDKPTGFKHDDWIEKRKDLGPFTTIGCLAKTITCENVHLSSITTEKSSALTELTSKALNKTGRIQKCYKKNPKRMTENSTMRIYDISHNKEQFKAEEDNKMKLGGTFKKYAEPSVVPSPYISSNIEAAMMSKQKSSKNAVQNTLKQKPQKLSKKEKEIELTEKPTILPLKEHYSYKTNFKNVKNLSSQHKNNMPTEKKGKLISNKCDYPSQSAAKADRYASRIEKSMEYDNNRLRSSSKTCLESEQETESVCSAQKKDVVKKHYTDCKCVKAVKKKVLKLCHKKNIVKHIPIACSTLGVATCPKKSPELILSFKPKSELDCSCTNNDKLDQLKKQESIIKATNKCSRSQKRIENSNEDHKNFCKATKISKTASSDANTSQNVVSYQGSSYDSLAMNLIIDDPLFTPLKSLSETLELSTEELCVQAGSSENYQKTSRVNSLEQQRASTVMEYVDSSFNLNHPIKFPFKQLGKSFDSDEDCRTVDEVAQKKISPERQVSLLMINQDVNSLRKIIDKLYCQFKGAELMESEKKEGAVKLCAELKCLADKIYAKPKTRHQKKSKQGNICTNYMKDPQKTKVKKKSPLKRKSSNNSFNTKKVYNIPDADYSTSNFFKENSSEGLPEVKETTPKSKKFSDSKSLVNNQLVQNERQALLLNSKMLTTSNSTIKTIKTPYHCSDRASNQASNVEKRQKIFLTPSEKSSVVFRVNTNAIPSALTNINTVKDTFTCPKEVIPVTSGEKYRVNRGQETYMSINVEDPDIVSQKEIYVASGGNLFEEIAIIPTGKIVNPVSIYSKSRASFEKKFQYLCANFNPQYKNKSKDTIQYVHLDLQGKSYNIVNFSEYISKSTSMIFEEMNPSAELTKFQQKNVPLTGPNIKTKVNVYKNTEKVSQPKNVKRNLEESEDFENISNIDLTGNQHTSPICSKRKIKIICPRRGVICTLPDKTLSNKTRIYSCCKCSNEIKSDSMKEQKSVGKGFSTKEQLKIDNLTSSEEQNEVYRTMKANNISLPTLENRAPAESKQLEVTPKNFQNRFQDKFPVLLKESNIFCCTGHRCLSPKKTSCKKSIEKLPDCEVSVEMLFNSEETDNESSDGFKKYSKPKVNSLHKTSSTSSISSDTNFSHSSIGFHKKTQNVHPIYSKKKNKIHHDNLYVSKNKASKKSKCECIERIERSSSPFNRNVFISSPSKKMIPSVSRTRFQEVGENSATSSSQSQTHTGRPIRFKKQMYNLSSKFNESFVNRLRDLISTELSRTCTFQDSLTYCCDSNLKGSKPTKKNKDLLSHHIDSTKVKKKLSDKKINSLHVRLKSKQSRLDLGNRDHGSDGAHEESDSYEKQSKLNDPSPFDTKTKARKPTYGKQSINRKLRGRTEEENVSLYFAETPSESTDSDKKERFKKPNRMFLNKRVERGKLLRQRVKSVSSSDLSETRKPTDGIKVKKIKVNLFVYDYQHNKPSSDYYTVKQPLYFETSTETKSSDIIDREIDSQGSGKMGMIKDSSNKIVIVQSKKASPYNTNKESLDIKKKSPNKYQSVFKFKKKSSHIIKKSSQIRMKPSIKGIAKNTNKEYLYTENKLQEQNSSCPCYIPDYLNKFSKEKSKTQCWKPSRVEKILKKWSATYLEATGKESELISLKEDNKKQNIVSPRMTTESNKEAKIEPLAKEGNEDKAADSEGRKTVLNKSKKTRKRFFKKAIKSSQNKDNQDTLTESVEGETISEGQKLSKKMLFKNPKKGLFERAVKEETSTDMDKGKIGSYENRKGRKILLKKAKNRREAGKTPNRSDRVTKIIFKNPKSTLSSSSSQNENSEDILIENKKGKKVSSINGKVLKGKKMKTKKLKKELPTDREDETNTPECCKKLKNAQKGSPKNKNNEDMQKQVTVKTKNSPKTDNEEELSRKRENAKRKILNKEPKKSSESDNKTDIIFENKKKGNISRSVKEGKKMSIKKLLKRSSKSVGKNLVLTENEEEKLLRSRDNTTNILNEKSKTQLSDRVYKENNLPEKENSVNIPDARKQTNKMLIELPEKGSTESENVLSESDEREQSSRRRRSKKISLKKSRKRSLESGDKAHMELQSKTEEQSLRRSKKSIRKSFRKPRRTKVEIMAKEDITTQSDEDQPIGKFNGTKATSDELSQNMDASLARKKVLSKPNIERKPVVNSESLNLEITGDTSCVKFIVPDCLNRENGYPNCTDKSIPEPNCWKPRRLRTILQKTAKYEQSVENIAENSSLTSKTDKSESLYDSDSNKLHNRFVRSTKQVSVEDISSENYQKSSEMKKKTSKVPPSLADTKSPTVKDVEYISPRKAEVVNILRNRKVITNAIFKTMNLKEAQMAVSSHSIISPTTSFDFKCKAIDMEGKVCPLEKESAVQYTSLGYKETLESVVSGFKQNFFSSGSKMRRIASPICSIFKENNLKKPNGTMTLRLNSPTKNSIRHHQSSRSKLTTSRHHLNISPKHRSESSRPKKMNENILLKNLRQSALSEPAHATQVTISSTKKNTDTFLNKTAATSHDFTKKTKYIKKATTPKVTSNFIEPVQTDSSNLLKGAKTFHFLKKGKNLRNTSQSCLPDNDDGIRTTLINLKTTKNNKNVESPAHICTSTTKKKISSNLPTVGEYNDHFQNDSYNFRSTKTLSSNIVKKHVTFWERVQNVASIATTIMSEDTVPEEKVKSCENFIFSFKKGSEYFDHVMYETTKTTTKACLLGSTSSASCGARNKVENICLRDLIKGESSGQVTWKKKTKGKINKYTLEKSSTESEYSDYSD